MISIIAAVSQNNVLGNNGKMPWHFSDDLKRFKKITSTHPVIMGRTTYESMGKALPKRTNIVLTSDPNYKLEDAIVVNSIEEAINIAKKSENSEEIFIIGGAKIFEQFLDIVDTMHLTIIHKDYEGDTFFDPDLSEWYLVSSETGVYKSDSDKFEYGFNVYERKVSSV